MVADLKPLRLYGSIAFINAFKVAIILKELDLPYEIEDIPFSDVKDPYYTKLNPNGRIPTLHDPNTNITLWESGAIVSYLVNEYDNIQHKLSFPHSSKEYHLANQWLHFQASGQGPYFGQWFWFQNIASEKVPSAIERYANEIKRVIVVLDKWLAGGEERETRPYLLGEKCTFADLAFVPWHDVVAAGALEGKFDLKTEAPHAWAWMEKMKIRPSVASLHEEQAALKAAMAK